MTDAWASSGGMSATILEVVENVMRPLVVRRPLVLLKGEAGSGRTTVLWEVERRLAGKRTAVYASGTNDAVAKLSGESTKDRKWDAHPTRLHHWCLADECERLNPTICIGCFIARAEGFVLA